MSRTPASSSIPDASDVPQEPSGVPVSAVSDIDTMQSGNLCPFSARVEEQHADSVEFGDHSLDNTPVPSVATPFDIFNDPYSPSDPAYVYHGDWSDFLDFSLYTEYTEYNDVPSQNETSSNSVAISATSPVIDHLPFTQALSEEPCFPFTPIDFTTDDWTAFFESQQYRDWYEAELARGAFDSFIYADASTSSYNHAPTLHPSVLNDEKVSTGHDALDLYGVAEPVATCYDSPSPSITTLGTPLMAIPPIASVDLHDLALMADLADDECDIHTAGDGEDSSEDEDMPLSVLRASDILRHYWRKGDVRYTISHAGRHYYLSAEQMHARFPGALNAFAKYWESKRGNSISAFRIMDYFGRHGHIGPFREPMYRFLPARIQRLLREDKYNFFF